MEFSYEGQFGQSEFALDHVAWTDDVEEAASMVLVELAESLDTAD